MKERSSMIFSLEMNSPIKPFRQEVLSDKNAFYELVAKNKLVNNINSSITKGQKEDCKKKVLKRNIKNDKIKQPIDSGVVIPTSPNYTSREACSRSFPNFQGSPLREAAEVGTPDQRKGLKVRRFSQGSAQHPASPQKHSPYAGAKFGDAPAPRVLPLPPLHWIPPTHLLNNQPYNITATQHLKSMLQIKA